MTAAVTPLEIRQARAFLQQRGVRTSDIAPRRFVAVAKETGKTFSQTLNYLALLLSGGSGNGPSPIATAGEDRLDPQRALGDMTPNQKLLYDSGHEEQEAS
jgi:hypothetical protein